MTSSITQAVDNNLVTTDFEPSTDVFKIQIETQKCIQEIINVLINDSYSIIRDKKLDEKKNSYAASTLSKELLINASFALFELGPQIESVEADEDLELPKPDQWCSGVIEFVKPEEIHYRTNELPERNPPTEKNKKEKEKKISKTVIQTNKTVSDSSAKSTTRRNQQKQARSSSINSNLIQQPISNDFHQEISKPQVPHSTALVNKYESFKKQMMNAGKNFTVDSEMNVIPINDPKIASNLLIVPRVTAKKANKPVDMAQTQQKKARSNIQLSRPLRKRHNPTSKLIPTDQPIFDNDIPDVSADHFIIKPGVTIKDGTMVKSAPLSFQTNKYTRNQYNEYVQQIKENSEID